MKLSFFWYLKNSNINKNPTIITLALNTLISSIFDSIDVLKIIINKGMNKIKKEILINLKNIKELLIKFYLSKSLIMFLYNIYIKQKEQPKSSVL